MYCDGGLDNEIQNVFDACKKYDRESGTAPVLTSVFPTGRVSDVKDAPLMQEPLFARELLQRLKALGSTHTCAALIPALKEKITVSENAIKVYDELGKELAMIGIQEEIVQRKLRDQYQLKYPPCAGKARKSQCRAVIPCNRKKSKTCRGSDKYRIAAAGHSLIMKPPEYSGSTYPAHKTALPSVQCRTSTPYVHCQPW